MSASIGLLCSLCAHAETSSDEIQVYAGLEPVLSLTCTDVNFGVYQVSRGNRGITGNTQVNMGFQTDAFTGSIITGVSFTNAGQDQIALSEKPQYADPSVGVCIVSGSKVRNQLIDVSSAPSGVFTFIGDAANPFAPGLSIASQNLAGFQGVLSVPSTVQIDNKGEGEFRVTGSLLIPNNLAADNYGAYKAVSITITVDDGE